MKPVLIVRHQDGVRGFRMPEVAERYIAGLPVASRRSCRVTVDGTEVVIYGGVAYLKDITKGA